MEVIRRHPELTLRILEPVPTFTAVAELAACHHERLDGRGYFRGLTEPELALGARIVAVADVFEALTAERPYRAAMPIGEGLGIMRGRKPASTSRATSSRHSPRPSTEGRSGRHTAPAAQPLPKLTRNSSVPSSAIEMMNPPMFGATIS